MWVGSNPGIIRNNNYFFLIFFLISILSLKEYIKQLENTWNYCRSNFGTFGCPEVATLEHSWAARILNFALRRSNYRRTLCRSTKKIYTTGLSLVHVKSFYLAGRKLIVDQPFKGFLLEAWWTLAPFSLFRNFMWAEIKVNSHFARRCFKYCWSYFTKKCMGWHAMASAFPVKGCLNH